MVETRGSRRKSVAPSGTPSKPGENEGPTSSDGAENGTTSAAQATIHMYRQQFLQRQQEEQRTAWRRFVSRVRLRWYQYEMSYGPYMLERWERNLVLAVILSAISLTLYGTYNVALRYLALL